MAFNILGAIATSLIGKALGGGGQQEQSQSPIFDFRRRTRVPYIPEQWNFRGVDPRQAALADSPIVRAIAEPTEPEQSKAKKGFNLKDEFLSSLTGNLVQRMIFGGQQPSYQYTPPTFR